ncbi:MAG: methyltransferase domain-containing protein [Pseudodesulfovibrio sp.]|nr:methyltransferase domain-containing protein [Pseudodesulfovibrio sp.]
MNLPSTLTKDLIRRSFDRARNTYAKAAKVQAEVARICASRIPEGSYPRILEIGAGGGVLTHFLAKRCVHERYIGVDIAPGMLTQVDKSMLTNPKLIAADGEFLGFPQDSFDLLASSSTMQWYRAPKISMVDNVRLLKRGGRFSFAIFVEGTFAELSEASGKSGFGSMLPMRSARFFIDIMQDAAPAILESEVITHIAHHPTVADLLRAHRATGATAAPGAKHPSKDAYRRFLEYYEAHFREEEGVRASAEILYLWGQW